MSSGLGALPAESSWTTKGTKYDGAGFGSG